LSLLEDRARKGKKNRERDEKNVMPTGTQRGKVRN